MRPHHQFSMEYAMLQATTRALLDMSLTHNHLGRPEETLCTKAIHLDPPQYFSSSDHAEPSPPPLSKEDTTTMECMSPLHHNENDQAFPIIEWNDEEPSFESIDARGSQPTVSCSTRDCVNDRSCRLHSLSLDHRTLHRSMAFMENLSSLDENYSERN
jgi:hypothetical protein